jgi:hypothetical protein
LWAELISKMHKLTSVLAGVAMLLATSRTIAADAEVKVFQLHVRPAGVDRQLAHGLSSGRRGDVKREA